MGRFDEIENKLSKVVKGASLHSVKEKKEKNILVYNVPIEWVEILKNSGFSFSSYAKMAIMEKMKRDGLL